MKPELQSKLLHGPYVAPEVRVGQVLECELRGRLKVRRFSTGPLVWPMGHPGGQDGGRHSYIVCGDLVRAIRSESSQAVQQWWGVSEAVVTRWRAALGVEINTAGTHRLRVSQSSGGFSPERLARLRAHALRRQQQKQLAQPLSWPIEEEALLGMMPDGQAAEKLGRPVSMVQNYRKAKGIAAYCRGRSTARALPPGRVRLSGERLRARRSLMGLLPTQVAQQSGLSWERYRNYEKFALRQVEPEVVRRLADALNCSPEDLTVPEA